MTAQSGIPLFKHILIVGANRGIGLGLVKEALIVYPEATIYTTARDTKGATDLQELAKKYGSRVDILELDMLDEQSVSKAAEYLKRVTSKLDLAIFNAGVALGVGSLPDLSFKDLLDNFTTNVVGPHNLFKAFSPLVEVSQSDQKSIAVISSIAGSIGTLPKMVPTIKRIFKLDYSPIGGYSVTKSGVNMLGRQWGEYLEPRGVIVPLIHPGSVATGMNKHANTISVEESATGVFEVINNATLASCKEEILSHDGTTYPW